MVSAARLAPIAAFLIAGLLGAQGPTNFGNRSRVTKSSQPWSAMCKVIPRKQNQCYGGSGVMIDPYHVLTAAHNLRSLGKSGKWRDSIEVIPAYRGDLNPNHGSCRTPPETQPYGVAKSPTSLSKAAWIAPTYLTTTVLGEALQHDIAVVKLDRPIGAFSGFMPYEASADLRFFTERGWYTAGYPSDGPYDGRLMYSRYGSFDSKFSMLKVYPKILWQNSLHSAGESGSPFWKHWKGRDTVFAVVNSFSPPSNGWAVRIDATARDAITKFLDSSRPKTVDLEPIEVEGFAYGQPGSVYTVNLRVLNYSQQDFNGRLSWDVYLSEDRNITPADRKIGSFSQQETLGKLQNKWFIASGVLPRSVPYGGYKVGVILTTRDAVATNNAAAGRSPDVYLSDVSIWPEDSLPSAFRPMYGGDAIQPARWLGRGLCWKDASHRHRVFAQARDGRRPAGCIGCSGQTQSLRAADRRGHRWFCHDQGSAQLDAVHGVGRGQSPCCTRPDRPRDVYPVRLDHPPRETCHDRCLQVQARRIGV